MILTAKQEEGLRVALERYKAREKYTCISGYAGSGKSTLVSFIVAALNINPDDVCYIAFTGKAATVLKQKGCNNAITAHKLLFYSKQTKEGKYIHSPRKTLEYDYKLIIVDEVSMLPKSMWDLLLSHHTHVLALGDPGQLPPVNTNEYNDVLEHPHVFLDEIMRQAQDSEIIRLSMHVREGKALNDFKCEGAQVQIYQKEKLTTGMLTWADQILCATNETRNIVNKTVRGIKGFGEEPCEQDRLISLANHWEFMSSKGDWALTNGCIGTLGYHYVETYKLPKYMGIPPIEIMYTTMLLEDDEFVMIPIDYKCLKTGEPTLTPRQQYQIRNSKLIEIDPPFEFAYGNAITTWKAQGSEWNKVLGIEEKFPFDKETHKQFLYTMVTRAKDKLVLITK